jgi:hypothetical protein
LWREYDGGDHAIIVGAVKNLILPEQPVTPMVYHKGKLGPLPPWPDGYIDPTVELPCGEADRLRRVVRSCTRCLQSHQVGRFAPRR